MTTDQLRKFQDVRPFQPYVIHLADSRQLTVRHPELLNLSQGGRIAAIMHREGVIEVVDLLLVTSLRPLSEAQSRRKKSR